MSTPKQQHRVFITFICCYVLLLGVSCRKTIFSSDTLVLRSLDVGSKDLSFSKRSKNIKGTYGVLTNDPRFECTDIVTLSSGALMAVLGNSFDHADNTSVFKCYSYDNGVNWTVPQNLNLPPSGHEFTFCNLFRVNTRIFLVLNRVGETARTSEGGIPAICYSDDEGNTWSKPKLMLSGSDREIVIINARNITITKTGRIIVPVSGGQYGVDSYHIKVIYSDNNGGNWVESSNLFKDINTADPKFAEPSIGQLKDGRLIMLIRTSFGHIYKSYSWNNGNTWSTPACTPLVSPWAAHSIRITRHGYVVVAYTNSISNTSPGYPRNNLKFAVSYDNGESWRPSGTILEIPESQTEFLMEPNITFTNNDKCLVTFFRQLNANAHRIETAIFNTPDVLRDEENWEDLRWWSVAGDSGISTKNHKLHLTSSSNSESGVYKKQIISNKYVVEFRAKVNSFVPATHMVETYTLGLKVMNGDRLLFRMESDGIYAMDYSNLWVKYSVPTYLDHKFDWHTWRFEVSAGHAKIFMDGINVVEGLILPQDPIQGHIISFFSQSNDAARTDCVLDFTYYDPL